MSFAELLNDNNIIFLRNAPTRKISTIRAGGECAYLVYPRSEDELIFTYKAAREHRMRTKVIGNMSDTVVSDNGYDGVLISTERLDRSLCDDNYHAYVEAGILLPKLIRKLASQGRDISAGLGTIPASIGGAVVNNAGAHGSSVSDVLTGIRVYNADTDEISILDKDEAGFSYRTSLIKKSNIIILGAYFEYKRRDPDRISDDILRFTRIRREKQPSEPNLGCFFKNPRDKVFAAELIEGVGLKGITVGDAQVSTKHSGFIVNKGKATVENILDLSMLVRRRVYNRYGIYLEYEAEIIG